MMNQLKSKYRLSSNYTNPTKKNKLEGCTNKDFEKNEDEQLPILETEEIIKHRLTPLDQQKVKREEWNPDPFVEMEMAWVGAGYEGSVLDALGDGGKVPGEGGHCEKVPDEGGYGEKVPDEGGYGEIFPDIEGSDRKNSNVVGQGERIPDGRRYDEKIPDARGYDEVISALVEQDKMVLAGIGEAEEIAAMINEVEINHSQSFFDGRLQARGEPITPVVDEKRAKYYSMRQIARENMSFYTDIGKIFYEQGQFMEDFEDDYEKVASFPVHFPYYQRMGLEQLRTYFTWRTKVRKGDISLIPSSYAFLYMYELLNQIGVKCPEDGLSKLMTFWQKFREIDAIVDKYVLQWLKDYHIYYRLPQSFLEFARANNLIVEYPTVFGYSSNEENSFDIFVKISKYKIKESIFYTEENREVISSCFYFILDRFRDAFRDANQCFEDLIFYSQSEGLSWSPFRRALFYPVLHPTNRQIVISEKEVYTSDDEGWHYRGVMLTEQGRRLLGYIMREMECSLRKLTKFKYKLTANPKVCSEKSIIALKEKGIVFPNAIREWVNEFYLLLTRTEVKVDAGNLRKIREQALQTQERLIVPEEQQSASLSESVEKSQFEKKEKAIVFDPWRTFKESLTEFEMEALELLLEEQPISSFAIEKGMMLEVLIDGINEKAMDSIGDTLLEIDDTVSIYEEYKGMLL
jgi:hypothetical protein